MYKLVWMIELCCQVSDDSTLKYVLPIITALIVFLLSTYHQSETRKKENKEKIANDIIATCDKMIRSVLAVETNTLAMRYHFARSEVTDSTKLQEEERNLSMYYHKKAEDGMAEYDLLKSDLKKTVKDLKIYWPRPDEVKKILAKMSIAVLKNPRPYDNFFVSQQKTNLFVLDSLFNTEKAKIPTYIFFEGVGLDLVIIQKIIDPSSPTLYMTKEFEEKLMDKISLQKIL